MIEAVKDLKTEDKVRALSSATFSLAPDPSVEAEESKVTTSKELRDQILLELRQELNIREDDDSAKAKSRLFAAIADALNSYLMEGGKKESIRSRLGQRGELPLSKYEIVVPEMARDAFADLGVRRREITDAVLTPSFVEHLMKDKVEAGGYPAISLYAKHVPAPGGKGHYTLLVHSVRIAYTQQIAAVWRIISPGDAAIECKPSDMLKEFVQKYGISFRFAYTDWRKLFLDETFEVIHPEPAPPVDAVRTGSGVWMQLEGGLRNFLFSPSTMRVEHKTSFHIAIAYVIDAKRYVADLREFGFNIQLPPADTVVPRTWFQFFKPGGGIH